MRRIATVVLALSGLLGCDMQLGDGSHDLSHPRMAAMLDAHNTLRATASPTPEPALDPLIWSNEVAESAGEWASRCIQDHDPDLHDLELGENWRSFSVAGMLTANEVVFESGWALEAADYDYESNTCAGEDNPFACGHYTQIVWRDTTEVGCAFQECPNGLRNWRDGHEIWVCRYSPPGNWQGQWPY